MNLEFMKSFFRKRIVLRCKFVAFWVLVLSVGSRAVRNVAAEPEGSTQRS